jgi:SAM-dependent methyltransferase
MNTAQFDLHAQIENQHWWFTGRRQILRRLSAELLDNTDKHPLVIDIGCGTGANLAAFADQYQCLGIDTSTEAIALARRQYPQLQFVHGYAPDDIHQELRQAKLVMLNDVLEHVKDDFLLLSRILAELSPGALCLITVPAEPELWSQHDESFGHYRRYTLPRLQMLWEGLPLQPRLVSHFNTRLYPIIKTVRTVNRWLGRSAGKANTDFNLPPAPVNHCLQQLFAGEYQVLSRALRGQRRGYTYGASLVAVLERLPGTIQALSKPLRAGPDLYDPQTQRRSTSIQQPAEPHLVSPGK